MSPIEIREEKGKIDFRSVLDLIRAEWPAQWGEASDERMIEEFEKSGDPVNDVNKYLVEEGRIVGWYRYSRWPREETNLDDAHTLDIAIVPERQGKGYGSRLMRDMIEDCGRRGYKRLLSRTFKDNAPSIELHKKAGFTEAFRTDDSIVWEYRFTA